MIKLQSLLWSLLTDIDERKGKQVTQGQYMFSDTHFPALCDWSEGEQGSGPEGNEVLTFIRPAWDSSFEAWEGCFEAWFNWFEVWEGWFEVRKGRFEAWEA